MPSYCTVTLGPITGQANHDVKVYARFGIGNSVRDRRINDVGRKSMATGFACSGLNAR